MAFQLCDFLLYAKCNYDILKMSQEVFVRHACILICMSSVIGPKPRPVGVSVYQCVGNLEGLST